MRTSRCARPARAAGSQDRAEEHELVPLHRTRHQRRDRPSARHPRGRRGGDPETLHFDPESGAITSLRSKEEAHDYRYFPEPDLVPVADRRRDAERRPAAMPELPAARSERLRSRVRARPRERAAAGLQAELGDYFEAALQSGAEPRRRRRCSPTGSAASCRRLETVPTPPTRASSASALAVLVGTAGRQAAEHGSGAQRSSTVWWPRAATPVAIIERRDSPRWRARDGSRP